ncbi:MAG: hypothetical protein O3A25_17005 [Acidobacteria bacterium]|nr:hypothetical protein [Acidobacteriota bacterium]
MTHVEWDFSKGHPVHGEGLFRGVTDMAFDAEGPPRRPTLDGPETVRLTDTVTTPPAAIGDQPPPITGRETANSARIVLVLSHSGNVI